MNMLVSRNAQPAPFAATATKGACVMHPALGKQPALSGPMAVAVWATALMGLKAMIEQNRKAACDDEKGQQGASGDSPSLAGGHPDAAAPKTAVAALGGESQNAGGGFDFQMFADLVRQLCNSAFSSGSGMPTQGDQPQEGCAPAQAGGQVQQPVDPQKEQTRMETINILGRHEDKFKKAVDGKGLDKLLNDEDQPADKKTPPDLKRAIQNLKSDPQMMDALDKAKNGKKDGKISAADINKLQGNSANRQYAEAKAESYEETYIPSDSKDPNAKARPITNNDAQRELFRYSDYLPKHVSREGLQKIVDGTAAQGKAPPQLVAAAKFYVDHPAAWEKDMGKGADESIRKDGMCNRFAKSVELTADEDKTLDVLDKNRDTFFGKGALTDSKLKKIAADPAAKAEVRDAATALLDKKDSLLYTMLDNGKHGNGGNAINAADDRKIGAGDLDALMKHRNKTIAPAETTAPSAAEKAGSSGPAARVADPSAAQAAQDMSDGQQDQPDAKKKKGGQLRDIATFFLKAYSFVMNVASSVLSVLAKVPGLGLLAAPAALAASALSGAAKVGVAALEGKDTKNAAMMMGIGVAGTAAGLLVPGGGKLVAESAKVAAKEGAKEGVEVGAKEGAKAGAKTWGQKEIVKGSAVRSDVVAQKAGKSAAGTIAFSAATTAADKTGVTDAALGGATNEYHRYEMTKGEKQGQPAA